MLILEINLVPLTDFDLLDILDLLENLLITLVVALEVLISLVTAVINRGLKKCVDSEGEEIE